MRSKLFRFTFCLWFISISFICVAEASWKIRADIQVKQPGLVESVLIPELHERLADGSLDLTFAGPDGNPRAFELYWLEPESRISMDIKPVRFEFKGTNAFEWEGSNASKLNADTIVIEMGDSRFVSKVTVEGYVKNRWMTLKLNEAIFRTRNQSSAELSITSGTYSRIRLRFTGFDEKYETKFTPVTKVTLLGTKPGRNYIKRTLSVKTELVQLGEELEIRAILPGSGLNIGTVHFSTLAQFQGYWKIGYETIKQGEQTFVRVKQGKIPYVSGMKQSVAIDLKRDWPSRSLVIKLDTKGKYVGDILNFEVDLLLPRFIFYADLPGQYTAMHGKGQPVSIRDVPGDTKRTVNQLLQFSNPTANVHWKSMHVTEKFQIKGGPFDDTGYAWNSLISISRPGYYRLILNQDASHEKNRNIRVVKNNIQVPFIYGRNKLQQVNLTDASSLEYNKEDNQSIITVHLPHVSEHWSRIILQSSGIFQRLLQFEIPKPVNMGWQEWTSKYWLNDTKGPTKMRLPFNRFPSDQDRFRIIINHGDNSPIEISGIEATYTSPTILFLAYEVGDYHVYGGNTEANLPEYDLTLVQSFLLEEIPDMINMGAIHKFQSSNWKDGFFNLFRGKNWGLYIVLGLVTIVLLVLIYMLFPKVE